MKAPLISMRLLRDTLALANRRLGARGKFAWAVRMKDIAAELGVPW